MFIEFCKSKIKNAVVTDAQLHYEGSITVDEKLLKAAEIIPGQKVQVLNVNTGERFETYAIKGKAGSGEVCLNGPAARLGVVGDKVLILNYVFVDPQEAKGLTTKLIMLDDRNRLKN